MDYSSILWMERTRGSLPVSLWKSMVATSTATTASWSVRRSLFSSRGNKVVFSSTKVMPFWKRAVVKMTMRRVAKTINIATRAIKNASPTPTGLSPQTPKTIGYTSTWMTVGMPSSLRFLMKDNATSPNKAIDKTSSSLLIMSLYCFLRLLNSGAKSSAGR